MPKKQSTTGARKAPSSRDATIGRAKRLSPKQALFVDEYLVDLNATQAAIRAGYSQKTAAQIGEENLRKPEIAAAIAKRMKAREIRTEITQDRVLQLWWDIATADAAELTAIHYRCCRHCHGQGHEYQWIDQDEYARAVANARKNQLDAPSDEGGYGYSPLRDPHQDCPKCFGQGQLHVHLADTRKLSSSGRLLFDGVKESKFGIEIKVQDRAKALENVAKHLGMFKQDVNLGVQEGNPLLALMQQVAGKTLKPVPDEGLDE